MRSENTLFAGGPLDGRVLPVLTGLTGRPPKWYDVPVPNGAGEPPTVHAYRRRPAGFSRRLGLQQGWTYEYAPEGHVAEGPRWPWTRPPRPPHPER
ncbi:hypothetical protein [Streptomyces sp. 8L]|uniref:hypothetical protein n=1 Tax=unclassified Streptomyces TaxID=2593676 RepID=UPI001CD5233C|nr:hypothetical protein [Streptomyces sp. 8L]MCA1222344.1 hypothetical protein [Streptomyces sp. 8L]